ncbi:hypothetical protein PVK06_033482 [Gossypium arboreum]|uniref:Uncharacterized protein n=1 Tax=Gossypium arboreum TaxID=29729 RepID=A0ABR0NBI2_GOSAR|nr:hypothetical protein PVK06_033482 [Gossypium arboreum]
MHGHENLGLSLNLSKRLDWTGHAVVRASSCLMFGIIWALGEGPLAIMQVGNMNLSKCRNRNMF